MGVLLLGLPTAASASWLHKGKGELKENASVTMSGEVTLTTSAGNVSCPTTIESTLTKESTAGDVNSYTVSEPSKCDLTGSLGSICGTHGLTKVEKTGTWGLTASESDIAVSSIDLHFTFAGCLISKFRLKGSATLSVNKASAISSVTFSGSQTLYNSLEEEAGSGSLGGTLSMSPAATYGTQPVPIVNTKWQMDDEPLSDDQEVSLSGNFSFSYSNGTVSCPVTATLVLADKVEEEKPEGEVGYFAVPEPSKCDVTGTLGTLCGTSSVVSVEKTGTWNLTTNEEDISVSGLALDYKFNKCAIPSLRVEGNATLTVDERIAIEEATFEGTASVFNSSEEQIGVAEFDGFQGVSPAGTFGISDEPSPAPEMFFHQGSPIGSEHPETGFVGTLYLLKDKEYSLKCPAHTLFTVKTNSADLSEITLTTTECEGAGILQHCELTEDELVGAPTLVPKKEDMDLTNLALSFKLATKPGESGQPCSLTGYSLKVKFTEMTLTPDFHESIHTVYVSGGVSLFVEETPVATAETSGEFESEQDTTIGLTQW